MSGSHDPSVVPAAEAAARAAELGLPPDGVMAGALGAARALAVAPISGFPVGAVVRGLSGALYLGANLEFAGLPLGASVHAEQSAVANAWAHAEAGVTALAVTAAPCGHCRQFLYELVSAARLRVLVSGADPTLLPELLPAAFGPSDLGLAGVLLQPQRHGLALAATMRPATSSPPPPWPPPMRRTHRTARSAPASRSSWRTARFARRSPSARRTTRPCRRCRWRCPRSPRPVPFEAIAAAVLVEVPGPRASARRRGAARCRRAGRPPRVRAGAQDGAVTLPRPGLRRVR